MQRQISLTAHTPGRFPAPNISRSLLCRIFPVGFLGISSCLMNMISLGRLNFARPTLHRSFMDLAKLVPGKARPGHHYHDNFFSPFFIGQPDAGTVKHAFMTPYHLFHFAGIDILSTRYYHVVPSIDDVEKSVFILPAHVPGGKVLAPKRLRGFLGAACSIRRTASGRGKISPLSAPAGTSRPF